MKYYIKTFGCKVSQYESQSIRENWNRLGFEEVDEPSKGNILLIASCAVTQEGISDARQLCNTWAKKYPQAHLIVTGCGARIFKNDFKNAKAIICQKNRHKLLEENPLDLQGFIPSPSSTDFPPFFIKDFKRTRPVVKVQDGCSHNCTYCIVPHARGASKSRPLSDILEEVERLLEKDFKEFILSGINLNQYSYENKDFWDILSALEDRFAGKYQNKVRFRLSSLEPAQLNNKGISVLKNSSLLCPHLHLSLQSGSQSVLKRMGRQHYPLSFILQQIEKVEKLWGDFGLGADFLMGFPEESTKEFEETLNFIKNMPFTYSHVFPFSPRPHTLAAKMENQVSKEIKKERTRIVRKIIQDKQEIFFKKMLEKDNLIVAFDSRQKEKSTFLTGTDQYYNTCILEHTEIADKSLISVKALTFKENSLLVII